MEVGGEGDYIPIATYHLTLYRWAKPAPIMSGVSFITAHVASTNKTQTV